MKTGPRRPRGEPLYDCIGRDYDVTRRADPRITQRIVSLLNPSNGGGYLDLGCGTGNYTIALRNTGLVIHGVDQSELMIPRAKDKAAEIPWHIGNAEALPFATGLFDGVTCILAVHHFRDLRTAFKEARRVINRGRLSFSRPIPSRCWVIGSMSIFQGRCDVLRNRCFRRLCSSIWNPQASLGLWKRVLEFRPTSKTGPRSTCGLRSELEFRRSQISHLKTKSQRGASDSSRISGQAVFTRWWQILRLRRVTAYLSLPKQSRCFRSDLLPKTVDRMAPQ